MAVLWPCGRGRPRRGRRRITWAVALVALILLQVSQSFLLPRRLRPNRLRERQAQEPDQRPSSRSLAFLAVKDAIYAALFGAPYDTTSTSGAIETVTGALSNFSSSAVTGAAHGVKAAEGFAGSVATWGLSKVQELKSFFHLSEMDLSGDGGSEANEASEAEVETPQVVKQQQELTPEPKAPAPLVESAQSFAPLFNDGSGLGAEPGDFFLFIKDYSWTLRYRVSQKEDTVDTERPLLLDWIKLRRPVQQPADLLEIPSSDLFDWNVVEPPRHSGFMYQVTEVVGSGVEAVINFFKNRGPKLLVQQDGVSLVNEEAEELPGKPVTHCWVQCLGLPFLPVLQYIAFLNHDEIVTDWHA